MNEKLVVHHIIYPRRLPSNSELNYRPLITCDGASSKRVFSVYNSHQNSNKSKHESTSPNTSTVVFNSLKSKLKRRVNIKRKQKVRKEFKSSMIIHKISVAAGIKKVKNQQKDEPDLPHLVSNSVHHPSECVEEEIRLAQKDESQNSDESIQPFDTETSEISEHISSVLSSPLFPDVPLNPINKISLTAGSCPLFEDLNVEKPLANHNRDESSINSKEDETKIESPVELNSDIPKPKMTVFEQPIKQKVNTPSQLPKSGSYYDFKHPPKLELSKTHVISINDVEEHPKAKLRTSFSILSLDEHSKPAVKPRRISLHPSLVFEEPLFDKNESQINLLNTKTEKDTNKSSSGISILSESSHQKFPLLFLREHNRKRSFTIDSLSSSESDE